MVGGERTRRHGKFPPPGPGIKGGMQKRPSKKNKTSGYQKAFSNAKKDSKSRWKTLVEEHNLAGGKWRGRGKVEGKKRMK